MMDIIRESLASFFQGLGAFLPNLLAVLIILIVGWFVARVLRYAVAKALESLKFPKAAKQAGIDDFLAKGGVKRTSTDLLAVLVYWLVMLVVLVIAVNALRLEAASQLLHEILLYIPNIIAARSSWWSWGSTPRPSSLRWCARRRRTPGSWRRGSLRRSRDTRSSSSRSRSR